MALANATAAGRCTTTPHPADRDRDEGLEDFSGAETGSDEAAGLAAQDGIGALRRCRREARSAACRLRIGDDLTRGVEDVVLRTSLVGCSAAIAVRVSESVSKVRLVATTPRKVPLESRSGMTVVATGWLVVGRYAFKEAPARHHRISRIRPADYNRGDAPFARRPVGSGPRLGPRRSLSARLRRRLSPQLPLSSAPSPSSHRHSPLRRRLHRRRRRRALPTATRLCHNDARFVADVTVPDGTIVGPGEAVDKRWSVLNAGTCDWVEGYSLVRVGAGAIEGPAELALFPARAGATAELRVDLQAPEAPGEYLARWRARAPDGTLFGEEIFVLIFVEEPTETPSPTALPTP